MNITFGFIALGSLVFIVMGFVVKMGVERLDHALAVEAARAAAGRK